MHYQLFSSSGKTTCCGIVYDPFENRRCTALVSANDEMASGAITVAHEVGIDVPEQLAVVGFDNVNFSHYTYPKLTTVDYPIEAIGQMAARWVLKHVYQQSVPDLKAVFQPQLIARDSA